MALKATIFKADLQIADMDRHYYGNHSLTLARHPSENDERMMVRLLSFALFADEALAFSKGISDADEPDIWRKDLTGAIECWIEVGQPDEKRILKACGRAAKVVIVSFGSSAGIWWGQVGNRLERARNLTVLNLPSATAQELGRLARRTMRLQCTIQDRQVWLTDGETTVEAAPQLWKTGA